MGNIKLNIDGKWENVASTFANEITSSEPTLIKYIEESTSRVNIESILFKIVKEITTIKGNISWLASYGGGGGGSSEDPITKLTYEVFYGGSDHRIIVDSDIEEKLLNLNSSKYIHLDNINCDNSYFYIAVCEDNFLVKVLTEFNEDITDRFVLNPSTFDINTSFGIKTYKLYEFHLESNLPLNARINITLK